MLKELEAVKLTEGSILVPTEKAEEAKFFFQNKNIQFIEIPVLMPEAVINSEVFKK